jgi:ribosomal protein S12 methylthiotransferase
LIKGRFRSRNHEEVVAEAHLLAERGVRELILVAQDTTYYGHDRQQDHALCDLLTDLNQVPNLAWIRVLYTHPQHWTDRLIEHFAELPRVVKAIDLPIQHINDRVLASMGRHNRRKDLEALLQSLRTRIPGVALRTSLIVGYPGETESEFQGLVEFVESFEFDRLGVFTYSHEENTPAYRLEDNIPAAEKTARQEELMLLQAEISEAKNQKLLQKTIPVLIDEWDADRRVSVGRTYRDAPEVDNSVLIPDQLGQGRFYPVLIRSVEMYDLFGIPNGNPIDLPPAGWE